jgi:hypothetical protein
MIASDVENPNNDTGTLHKSYEYRTVPVQGYVGPTKLWS